MFRSNSTGGLRNPFRDANNAGRTSSTKKSNFLQAHKWHIVQASALLILGVIIGTGTSSARESADLSNLDNQYHSSQAKLSESQQNLKIQEDKVQELDTELSKLKSEQSTWQDQSGIIAERDQTIATLNGQLGDLSIQRDECQATLAAAETSATDSSNGAAHLSEPAAAQPEAVVEAASDSAPADVYYKNCTAARAAGAAPVYVGEPGYGSHLDRDGDGVGCE